MKYFITKSSCNKGWNLDNDNNVLMMIISTMNKCHAAVRLTVHILETKVKPSIKNLMCWFYKLPFFCLKFIVFIKNHTYILLF